MVVTLLHSDARALMCGAGAYMCDAVKGRYEEERGEQKGVRFFATTRFNHVDIVRFESKDPHDFKTHLLS